MSPDPQQSGSVRSVADINDDIRALWERAGGQLDDEQRAEYRAYLDEYADAAQARIVRAA